MELRYYVEHIVMPALIKENPKQLTNIIAQAKEEFILSLFNKAAEGLNVKCEYKAKDFEVNLVKYMDKYFFQVIKFPIQDPYAPLCHFIIISMDEKQENARMFTIEHGTKMLLCEWKDDKHYAYGIFNSGEDPLKAIVEIRNRPDSVDNVTPNTD